MTFLDDVLQFLRRVIPLGTHCAAVDAHQAQQPVARRIQADHDRQQCRLQSQDQRRHIEHRVSRVLERQRFRHHFPDDDMQVSQH
ncbi:MAG: hypothetical protein O2930_12670 [Acidobacteria bacterium]|nr:hypothetical protein [Acidobacteriota bacterium]